MDEIQKTIKQVEAQLAIFNDKIRKITKERRDLYEYDIFVRRYAKLGEEKRELKGARENLENSYNNLRRKLIQTTCSHPLWYLLESTNKDNRLYDTCICFKCLTTLTGLSKEFKNCIKVTNPSYLSFANLLTKYDELKAVKPNEYYANRAMIKKYHGK